MLQFAASSRAPRHVVALLGLVLQQQEQQLVSANFLQIYVVFVVDIFVVRGRRDQKSATFYRHTSLETFASTTVIQYLVNSGRV